MLSQVLLEVDLKISLSFCLKGLCLGSFGAPHVFLIKVIWCHCLVYITSFNKLTNSRCWLFLQEKNQSRGSLGIRGSKPQGKTAQSCFFTFSRQNFCRGIIQSQDILHQDIWSIDISPRFILTVFHIDKPIKHMSALYLQWTCLFCKFVTQNTNTLGPGRPSVW